MSTGIRCLLGIPFILGFFMNDSVLASNFNAPSVANIRETKNGITSICSALKINTENGSTLLNQLAAVKRCEFAGEFKNPDNNKIKTCSYRCRGYRALANFSWPIDQSCPPSFDGNFPGP
jgi:hypothetical protein